MLAASLFVGVREERYDATAEPFGWRFGRNDADKLSPVTTEPTPTTPPDRPDSDSRPRSCSTNVGR